MPSASTCTPKVCLIPAEGLLAKHHQPSKRSGTLIVNRTPLVPARINPRWARLSLCHVMNIN
ncbi:hypothetical protein HBI56_167040 [Parastagonospora nodorum]|uniref:Uncharacterized protein n=1 Tax=Phaeosphaeria nodorum (strain SN15 / ATCC MYA-4574 / FGSC 10173) TaxID=321614 RepID=A0A7U2NQM8_PHANO|nr:hypothetical protein HBH56_074790 [Parastagonospora nodorum]QRD06793.1 hypothetical protein JI435_136910 [Parastagonospora nodorum SN15]KAH3927228.1 hypothetical protein HBH54_155030 [Parastagonospora nodorum]KAH3983067.1 hypothetical protein HBH52_069400 [Parastagonospora nodorum]KAH3994933.1 hypothetical protein HBI10_181680 [Parastagonospora nodorum]